MGSITSANISFFLAIPNVFNAPQQLQGFAVDDIFTTDDMQQTEAMMGVDGKLSFGFVFVPMVQTIALQADSNAIPIFDAWRRANRLAVDAYPAQGTVLYPALKKKYTLNNGTLSRGKAMPDALRVLQPQRFTLTWESVIPSNSQF